jgi:hypothetical protein
MGRGPAQPTRPGRWGGAAPRTSRPNWRIALPAQQCEMALFTAEQREMAFLTEKANIMFGCWKTSLESAIWNFPPWTGYGIKTRNLEKNSSPPFRKRPAPSLNSEPSRSETHGNEAVKRRVSPRPSLSLVLEKRERSRLRPSPAAIGRRRRGR